MLIVTPQAAPRLPIGTVLQYSGLLIANVAARTLPLGQEIGDTISDIPFGLWYVCNGNSGTPNILDKFVRCEDSSGVFGGSDLHTLTVAQMPSHSHIERNRYLGGGTTYEAAVGQLRDGTIYQMNPTTTFVGGNNSHNNMPAYYSLIFIIRMS